MKKTDAQKLRSGPKWNAESRWFREQCRSRGDVFCWKCHKLIDMHAEPRTPWSFSVDHALPIVNHPERVFTRPLYRAAHYKCNSAFKTDRPPAIPTPPIPEGFSGRWVRPSW